MTIKMKINQVMILMIIIYLKITVKIRPFPISLSKFNKKTLNATMSIFIPRPNPTQFLPKKTSD